MKDLWPSASRFWHLIKPGQKRSTTQILTLSDPKIRGQEPKTLSKRAHNPPLKEAGLTKPTGAVPWLGGDWYLWHAHDGLRNGKGHPLSVTGRAINPLAPGKCGDGPSFIRTNVPLSSTTRNWVCFA